MVKSNNFTISTKNYAFKTGSLRQYGDNSSYFRGWWAMDVFYYKKKDGKLTACFGTVHELMSDKENAPTEEQFIDSYRSSYGPDMLASWNGYDFIGTTHYDSIVEYVAELKPILEKYPAIPAGYVGWYKNP